MGDNPSPFVQVSLDWKRLLPSKRGGGGPEGGDCSMEGLPLTDKEFIATCQREYEGAAAHGGQEALDACFRLAWALVHSGERADQRRGVELAQALADHPAAPGDGEEARGLEPRDIQYLIAVGLYRQRHYIDARRVLKPLMQEHPEFRQGASLLEACDKEIVKDGLVGVGAGAAIAAVAAIAISALARR